jgi:stage II sporulation protein D
VEPISGGPSFDVSTQATPDIGVFTGSIRIGVIPSASSVQIGSAGDYVIKDKATGAQLLTGSNGTVTVSLAEGAVTYSYYRLQIQCAANVSALQTRGEAAGYRTYTAFNPAANCTRLMIGEFAPPPAATFSARTTFKNEAVSKGIAPSDAFWHVHTWTEGVTRYQLTRGSEVVTSSNPVILSSLDNLVQIGRTRYRGVAEVARNSGGTLAGINELPMEEYLYGVVPRELGPVAFPEMEAQKAQAVTARTWALAGFGKRIADGYNLRATTDDQVYGGFQDEHPISNQAVDETSGVVATFNGRLISTFYSSTTGGYTASFEEWLDGATPIPYLTGVPDAQRGQALENVPSLEVFKNHANPTSLRNAKEGDWESNWARYHRWVFQWTNAEMTRVISMFAGRDVGKVLEINVLERGPSGRVLKIEYVTENGTFTSTRNGIRSSLKFVNASGGLSNFLSTLFFIEPVRDPRTQELAGFKAYGGGFGHGVGMSQTGAVGMAEKGKSYEEILKHYYQGIELETKQ